MPVNFINVSTLTRGFVENSRVQRPQRLWTPICGIPLTAARYPWQAGGGYAVDLQHLGTGSLSLPLVGQSYPYLYD